MPAIKLFAGMARSYRCLAKSFSDKFSIGFPDFNYSLRLCAAANTPRKRRRLSVIPFISFCDNWAKAHMERAFAQWSQKEMNGITESLRRLRGVFAAAHSRKE